MRCGGSTVGQVVEVVPTVAIGIRCEVRATVAVPDPYVDPRKHFFDVVSVGRVVDLAYRCCFQDFPEYGTTQ